VAISARAIGAFLVAIFYLIEYYIRR